MPLLATFLGAMFTAALKIFVRFFSLEKAARMAAWSVALSLMVALVTAMMSCISGVCAQSIVDIGSISPAVGMGFGIAFNPITLSAIGCYISVWIICQLYVIKKQAINMIIKI